MQIGKIVKKGKNPKRETIPAKIPEQKPIKVPEKVPVGIPLERPNGNSGTTGIQSQ